MKEIKRIQLGKKGLTEEFVSQLKILFEKENIIKVQLLKSVTRNKEEAVKIAEEIIESLGKKYTYRIIGYVITINKFRKEVR